MFATLALFLCLCFGIGISQTVQLGGSPFLNVIFMLLVASGTPYLLIGSLKSTIPIMYIILLGGSLTSLIKYLRHKSNDK